jgi:hypothetical protein
VQKAIVLSVNGVLCFEDYKGFSPPLLDLGNVICRPGIRPFFRKLLQDFHVGIWSCMPPSRLDLVLAHLLPLELRSQLIFVYGQDKCVRQKPYPFFQKFLQRLRMDKKTRRFCKPGKVLMVDDCEWKNVMNGNHSCYFPTPWKGEMHLPNPRNVIPDVGTALLPFIMDLVHYDSVTEFLQKTPMDGELCRRSLRQWYTSRVEQ